MASINANFQGRLGADIKTLDNGSLTFNVAVDNHDKNKTTTWVSCFISNDNKFVYERATKFLKKGSGVYIQGGIRLNTYTNKDNQQITTLQCNVADFDFSLSSGKKDSDGATEMPIVTNNAQAVTASQTTAQVAPQVQTPIQVPNANNIPSDLPF